MKYFLLPFLLIANTLDAQEFSFKRVVLDGQQLKTNGLVTVNDSLITIKSDNQKAVNYPVLLLYKADGFSQYKLDTDGDSAINFTLQANQINNKTEKYTLALNIKSLHNSYSSSLVYFLIPDTRAK